MNKSMSHPPVIQNVVVLGAGMMGRQIAAHCINASLSVTLLDLKQEGEDPDKLAHDAVEALGKMKWPPLGKAEWAKRIKTGNFQDDWHHLEEADWICEAVVERMDIKKEMLQRVDEIRREDAVVSSNTSGLPIAEVSSDCSRAFREHFMGTHFFNPPRYMKLLEIIPTEETSEQALHFMRRFAERILGKGVVLCNDTPNFIANRIGVFSMASVLPWFFDGSFRAEELDVLTGTLTGYSKGATFRTADLAGLDVIKHVADNLYPAIPDDERRDVFQLPDDFKKMVDKGLLGNKAGAGFYKKVKTRQGKEYRVINPDTLDYERQQSVDFETIEKARQIGNDRERLRFLCRQDDEVGRFVWQNQKELLCYAARRLGEIGDNPEAIDRAMKWGFNWQLGPFERWDALGIDNVAERLRQEGEAVPKLIEEMRAAGRTTFYDEKSATVYHPVQKEPVDLTPPAEGAITVERLRAAEREVRGNAYAGLYDMGDGVALFEIRSPRATLGRAVIDELEQTLEYVPQHFDGLVVGHDGPHFAYGANLKEAIEAIQKGQREELKKAAERFQQMTVGMRKMPVPVVMTVFGRALGGGTEWMLRADQVVAHHELYAGLVELGVGLLPAGGGTTELLRRFMERAATGDDAESLSQLKEAFKVIGRAKVSDGAPRAFDYGYLRDRDRIVMHRDRLLTVAKQAARTLAEAGYTPPAEPRIRLMGQTGYSALELMLYIMHQSGWITDYDKEIGQKIAYVMTGGKLSEPREVPESYMLKLEREALMELMDDERTLKRLQHMMKYGKPLRN